MRNLTTRVVPHWVSSRLAGESHSVRSQFFDAESDRLAGKPLKEPMRNIDANENAYCGPSNGKAVERSPL